MKNLLRTNRKICDGTLKDTESIIIKWLGIFSNQKEENKKTREEFISQRQEKLKADGVPEEEIAMKVAKMDEAIGLYYPVTDKEVAIRIANSREVLDSLSQRKILENQNG